MKQVDCAAQGQMSQEGCEKLTGSSRLASVTSMIAVCRPKSFGMRGVRSALLVGCDSN